LNAAPSSSGAAGQDLLDGVTVIEVASGVAGPFAARLLADVGATCIKVERPQGDISRSWGPFPDGLPDLDRSSSYLAFNHGKTGLTLDLDCAAGRAELEALLSGADILVEDGALDVGRLHEEYPDLVILSLTPTGRTGPYANRPATELTAYAMGGAMSSTGLPDRVPYSLGGSLVQAQAGNVAACAAVAGLIALEQAGRGQLIDVSWVEAEMASMDRSAIFIATYSYTRMNATRQSAKHFPLPTGILPCADGFVVVSTYGWHITNMLDAIRSPRLDALLRERPGNIWQRGSEKIIEEEVLDWLKLRTRADASREGQAKGWIVGPVNDLLDIEADPWLSAAHALECVEGLLDRPVSLPGAAYRVAGGPRYRGPAPKLGQHSSAPHCRSSRHARSPQGEARNLAQPMEGVRVLDMTVVVAGPFATLILADLGAEVIQIESCQHYPNTSRGPRKLSDRGYQYSDNFGRGYVDSHPGRRPWLRRSVGNLVSRNKLSMTVDLTQASGREVFLQLCERADCVMENNHPDTLEKLDLTWDVLRERNPRLVLVRMPPLACAGPARQLKGVGSTFDGLSGLMSFRGYPDLSPGSVQPVYRMDAATGPTAAMAAMLAIRRARRTGNGCEVEVSQITNMLHHVADLLIGAQITGCSPPRLGNRHQLMSPHGCYRASGDDQWVVICCRDDRDWEALRTVTAGAGWPDGAELATTAARVASADYVDTRLESWTITRPAAYIENVLTRAGVPAAQVRNEAEKLADPHFRARDFFRSLDNVETGQREYPGHLWRTSGGALKWGSPAPSLGRDNEYVYRTVLGCSDEEWQTLVKQGHIGDHYQFEVAEQ
jgi:crotonobetainyl-CoA:carnitine CoA-transferase CaiB-like acyl-CoA transferase